MGLFAAIGRGHIELAAAFEIGLKRRFRDPDNSGINPVNGSDLAFFDEFQDSFGAKSQLLGDFFG